MFQNNDAFEKKQFCSGRYDIIMNVFNPNPQNWWFEMA